jgi:hypothetical protein
VDDVIGAWIEAGELDEARTMGSAVVVGDSFVFVGGTADFRHGHTATVVSPISAWAPTAGADMPDGLYDMGFVRVGDVLVTMGGFQGNGLSTVNSVYITPAGQ